MMSPLLIELLQLINIYELFVYCSWYFSKIFPDLSNFWNFDVADLILHQFRGLLLVADEELDVVLDQQFLHMGRLPSRFFSALIDWFVF